MVKPNGEEKGCECRFFLKCAATFVCRAEGRMRVKHMEELNDELLFFANTKLRFMFKK
jgi:hypothetical protein